jgi:ABC-type Zn uptake system ZnuABC Zn-binding protein ZnuA
MGDRSQAKEAADVLQKLDPALAEDLKKRLATMR